MARTRPGGNTRDGGGTTITASTAEVEYGHTCGTPTGVGKFERVTNSSASIGRGESAGGVVYPMEGAAKMAVGNNGEKYGNSARGAESTALVQEHAAVAAPGRRSGMACGNGGRPTQGKSRNLSGAGRCNNDSDYPGGPAGRDMRTAADSIIDGVVSGSEDRRPDTHQDVGRRSDNDETGGHVEGRQDDQRARTIRCGDCTAAELAGADQQVCPSTAHRGGELAVPEGNKHFGGFVATAQSRPSSGVPIDSSGGTPGDGSSLCARVDYHADLRTHPTEYSETIPAVGATRVGDAGPNDGSKQDTVHDLQRPGLTSYTHNPYGYRTFAEMLEGEDAGAPAHVTSREQKRWQPRWTKFAEAPELADIVGKRQSARTRFPLHLKSVRHLDLDKLLRLPIEDQELRRVLLDVLGWIMTPDRLRSIVARRPIEREPQNTFGKQDIEAMMQTLTQRLRRIQDEDMADRAYVRLFARTEEEKARRRILGEPLLNDNIEADDLQYAPPTEKRTIRRQVAEAADGAVQIQYDFQSYYDQFPLGAAGRFFCVPTRSHGMCELVNLPMGAKFSCCVAQVVTWALLSFTRPADVQVATCIDNVRFCGSRENVLAAAREFEARCAFVGAQFNDAHLSTEDRVTTSGVFCGEEYDFVHRTRRLNEKSITKLKTTAEVIATIWSNRVSKRVSYRQVAAIYGVLSYSAEVLRVDLCSLRSSLTAYCNLMKDTACFSTPDEWDQQVPEAKLIAFDWGAMEKKALECAHNIPVPAFDKQRDREVLIVTDASRWGWASMAFFAGGAVGYCAEPWTDEDHRNYRLESSVQAEPLAMVRAATRHFGGTRVDGGTVIFATDHAGMVFASARAADRPHDVKCEHYYNAIQRLRQLFPGAGFAIVFIGGKENPTDAGSRGSTDAGGAPISANEVLARTKTATELIAVQDKKRVRKPWML